MEKRGQQTMGMPFGLIFAIFLIVIFIVIAFIAVAGFLDIGDSSTVGMFYRDLQNEVNDAWNGQSSENDFDIDLPSGIKRVCFGNLSRPITNPGPEYEQIKNYEVYEANTFLVPPEYAEDMEWKLIDHLNISKMTATLNPYCVDAAGGLRIKKGFYDRSVTLQ